MIVDLNKHNFDIVVAKYYQGKFWTKKELEDDLRRVRYIKRLIGKYLNNKELKERLILNHLIILNNVFGPQITTKILFFKLEEQYWSILKTFLVFLNYLPESGVIYTINGYPFDTRKITTDLEVGLRLRNV